MLYDNVGNDLTVDLRANDNGGGSFYLYHSNNSARISLVASNTSGDLRLYSTNGLTRSRLHGGSDGSYLSLYTADGSTGLYLDGDDGGAGSIGVHNTNGSDRIFLDGQGNSGGGQIYLYTGDGDTAAILFGDVGGGADLRLYNTNSAIRLWLDGYGSSGGGQVQVLANDGSYTLNLQGDDGNGAGLVEVRNSVGSTGVRASGKWDGSRIGITPRPGVRHRACGGRAGCARGIAEAAVFTRASGGNSGELAPARHGGSRLGGPPAGQSHARQDRPVHPGVKSDSAG